MPFRPDADALAARDLASPDAALTAYRSQRRSARSRGQEWAADFDFRWWWFLWRRRWAERGTGRGQLQMVRRRDHEPWSLTNVSLMTHAEHMARLGQEARSARRHRAWRTMRERHGPGYGKGDFVRSSKAVLGPDGQRFGSIGLACEHAAISHPTLLKRIRLNIGGWRFE